MSDRADFLVEIGTEELPPLALRELADAFARGVGEGLAAAGLGGEGIEAFATPRRLAVRAADVALRQPTRRIEKRGPPVSAAFTADGSPTRAATAFAAGCGVDVAALERVSTAKGEWLLFRGEEPGQPAAALLPAIVEAALAALPVPRRMRWGAGDAEFVRPVHWVLMLLGHDVVPANLLGQSSGNSTRGHRFHHPEPVAVQEPSGYEEVLEAARVIVSFEKRRARVAEQIAAAAREAGGEAVADDALLDEVTGLVEWPVAVTGRFDKPYLELPEEVLVATLQGHQRYFPVRAASGELLASFVTVANVESRDVEQVRLGNERVVRPRLADAAFFWRQDATLRLDERVPKLAQVVYQRGLGTVLERCGRVRSLSVGLAEILGLPIDATARAAELAKADLLTELVGEFPELQGRVGYYYARRDGEPDEVARALEEQYLPRHAGDRLPAGGAGRALALADRLDALAGAFALGRRPSGNRDPFGLRRAALGILRILIEGGMELDLPATLAAAVRLQPVAGTDADALATDIYDFLLDRLRAWYLDGLAPGLDAGPVTVEQFEAVRVRRPASPLDFHHRMRAVNAFVGLPEAAALAAANKRIANILRNAGPLPAGGVDATRLEEPAERSLYEAMLGAEEEHRAALAERDYVRALRRLAALRVPVDDFFDAVLVMCEDPALRHNRLALLTRLRDMFLDVADASLLGTG